MILKVNSLKVNDSKTENITFPLNNSYNRVKDVKLLGVVWIVDLVGKVI